MLKNSSEIAVLTELTAILLSIGVLAFSAWRYTSIKASELKESRFNKYHQLIKAISKGADQEGLMKIQSQRAFIYELRNFPEYKDLTIKLLKHLLDDWTHAQATNLHLLKEEVDDTVSYLQSNKLSEFIGRCWK
jgi:hypothetical protein